MFKQRHNRNMAEAGFTTLALIYHQIVYKLRTDHRNAIVGLLLTAAQGAIFVVVLLAIYYLIGLRSSPLRGDFLLYIMSGIFMFMLHVKAVGAVAGSHSISAAIVKHEPLNAAVLIMGAALAALYRMVVACAVILTLYYVAFQEFTIYDPVGAACVFMLAWFSGVCVGLVFLGLRPWSPPLTALLTQVYTRVNMIFSGKMFVANALPGFVLPWFIWNPLFHIVDQGRGFVFINYAPQRTSLFYALGVSVVLLMIALLVNFTTRKYESVSWGAVQ